MKQLLFTFLFFITLIVRGSTNYYSRQSGAFTVNTTWSNSSHTGSAAGSAPCACACSISGNNYFEIDHTVTINCNLSFSGNPTVVIRSGGSLIVSGNASVTGSVTFDIQSGGTVNITGDFNVNGGGGSVTVDGTMTVGGNVIINGSYPVCGVGLITYGGNISGTGNVCNAVTVLPVTWLNVSAEYQNGKAEISWSTATEINNEFFTIEKSTDGVSYVPIATLPGSGNSTLQHNYMSVDEYPAKGINYYRIKQTDFDGHSEYSKVVALLVTKENKYIAIYPSLVSGSFINIRFDGYERQSAEVWLVDRKGTLLNYKKYELRNNIETVSFSLITGMKSDTYFLHVNSGDQSRTQKFIFLSH